MACAIADYYRYAAADGSFVAIAQAVVLAVPDLNTRRFASGGVFRPPGVHPDITSEAYKYGRRTTTGASGDFGFTLPYSTTETKPTAPTPRWSIVLPDGRVLTGAVPAVSGPLTLDDLETTHGWTWASSIYVAPVTAGVLARGLAPFVAQSSYTVLFGAPMATAAYVIKLTPSIDSGTSNIPAVGYANKSTSGFDIVTTGVYTGTVDWEVAL